MAGDAMAKMARNSNRGSKPGERRGGRQKGVPNKITTDVRMAFAELLQGRMGKLGGWIDKVAETDPGRAADLLMRAAEYHIPKLARSEIATPAGHELVVRVVRG